MYPAIFAIWKGRGLPERIDSKPADTAPPGAHSVAIEDEANEDIPEVARRLWNELLCACGEANCARPTLAACACEYAGKKRQEIFRPSPPARLRLARAR